jgi:hypothetical protein
MDYKMLASDQLKKPTSSTVKTRYADIDNRAQNYAKNGNLDFLKR